MKEELYEEGTNERSEGEKVRKVRKVGRTLMKEGRKESYERRKEGMTPMKEGRKEGLL